jgi:hypothetical protein
MIEVPVAYHDIKSGYYFVSKGLNFITHLVVQLVVVMKHQTVVSILSLFAYGSFGLHKRDGNMSNPKTPPVTVKGNGILNRLHVLTLY